MITSEQRVRLRIMAKLDVEDALASVGELTGEADVAAMEELNCSLDDGASEEERELWREWVRFWMVSLQQGNAPRSGLSGSPEKP